MKLLIFSLIIKKHGKPGIFLFNLTNFTSEGQMYFNEKIINNTELFELDVIQKNFMSSLVKIEKKIKEEYELKLKELVIKHDQDIKNLLNIFYQQLNNKDEILSKCELEIEELKKNIYNLGASQFFSHDENIDYFNNLRGESQYLVLF